MDKIIALVDDLILLEAERDKEWKNLMHSLHRSSNAGGDSLMLHLLRSLKELCVEEDKRLSSILDKPTMPISYEIGLDKMRTSFGCSSFHPDAQKALEEDTNRSAAD